MVIIRLDINTIRHEIYYLIYPGIAENVHVFLGNFRFSTSWQNLARIHHLFRKIYMVHSEKPIKYIYTKKFILSHGPFFLYVTRKMQFLLLHAEHAFVTKGTKFLQFHSEKKDQWPLKSHKNFSQVRKKINWDFCR